MKEILLYSGLFLIFSCGKNDSNTFNYSEEVIEADRSNIVINEISGDAFIENEFGKESDWIELYNDAPTEVILKEGDWTLSDNPGKPDKFILPETKVPPKGHLVIWCDKSDRKGSDIHANFKISSKGETIILYNKGVICDKVQIDSSVSEGGTFARVKDGNSEWVITNIASPNQTNLIDQN